MNNLQSYYNNQTITALISSYQNGDNRALNALFYKIRPIIQNKVISMIGDNMEVQDYVQEISLKIMFKIKDTKFPHVGSFISWVSRISFNYVGDRLRRKKIDKIDYSQVIEKINIGEIEEWKIEDRQLKILYTMMDQLSKEQQKIIKYRLYQKLSFKEISTIEDISVNTALGRYRYAIINLRKYRNFLY